MVRSSSWFICITSASMELFFYYRERSLSWYRDEFLKSTQQNLVFRCVNLHSILEKVILLTSQNSSFYCQHMKPVTFSFHYTFDKKIYNISVWGTEHSQFAMQWRNRRRFEAWNSHECYLKTQVPLHRQHRVSITKNRLLVVFNLQVPCVLYIGQAFHYSPENAFYIFNQQIYFIIWYLLDRASLI